MVGVVACVGDNTVVVVAEGEFRKPGVVVERKRLEDTAVDGEETFVDYRSQVVVVVVVVGIVEVDMLALHPSFYLENS